VPGGVGAVKTTGLAVVLAAVVLALVAGACGGRVDEGDAPGVPVVTTTTILADLVRQVGGDRVRVESLVPKGGEVHTFDPTPSDIRRVTDARVVVRNGLGLDDWLGDLVGDTGTQAPVIALGDDLPGVTLIAGEDPGGAANPHLWMNVAYASAYAARIADALATVDPDGAETYRASLGAYQERLATLDEYAKAQVGAIPEANRTVVSFHDAFPYFAAAYGLTIDGTVVDSPGQDPSAGQVAALVARIREGGVRAIFAEAQFNPDIVDTIAAETGATVVSDLYTDSVGDPPQDTYEGLMHWNIDRVVEALGG
jgi:ABC-type Zn uptake system ZnuABC Zn-binding protein ZnuA